MKLVILWTDYFVYLLALGVIIFIYKILINPRLNKKWRKLLYRPINLIATLILFLYATIGFLDSIHLKNHSSQIVSVLDIMLTPMRSQTEESYSAPFATHGFTKQTMILHNGDDIRVYPKLKYGGSHLVDPKHKWKDLGDRILKVTLQAIIIWGALSILITIFVSHKHRLSWEKLFYLILRGETVFPWRTLLISLAIGILLINFVYAFMPFYHLLGTGQVGEDVLYQTLKSIRTGLIIGTVTTLVTLPFAAFFGIMAGYFRGWIDDLIQYVYTTLSSIPGVLLIAAAVLSLQIVMERHSEWFQTTLQRSDARLLALCAILGITSWTSLCRFLRGETLKICQMDFISAAYSLGVSHSLIILKHILPNVMHIILITIALDFSGLVLAEAVLSYVGVGVDPASYSWGTMINSARLELARVPVIWWSLTAAFIFMFGLVLAANIFADAIRDIFDPRTHYLGTK